MTDVADLLERVAEQAGASARPPALAVLRRRHARRSAARAGLGATALAGVAALGLVLVPQSPAQDVVVTDAAPPATAPPATAPPATAPPATAPPAQPVPAGQVALPAWAARAVRLPDGARPVADLASSYATEDGPLVTAVRRDGDRLCWAVFTAGAPAAPTGGASCDPLDLPAYRSGRIELGAASEGPSGGGAVDWLVLTGSAPAGTRTVVVVASGGARERVAVTSAGAAYLDRAFFALPWVQQDTLVEALDGAGRVIASWELPLAMGQPG